MDDDGERVLRDMFSTFLRVVLVEDYRKNPSIAETPERAAKAWRDITSGYASDGSAICKTFDDGKYDQMVFVGGINFYSTCEHHLLPFFGTAHVGYIPSGKVIGLSKIPRIVEVFSRRLSMQERITRQIADALQEGIAPRGIGVCLQARHMCMEMRGVRARGSITQTVAFHGDLLNEAACRAEFMTLVKNVSDGVRGL